MKERERKIETDVSMMGRGMEFLEAYVVEFGFEIVHSGQEQ